MEHALLEQEVPSISLRCRPQHSNYYRGFTGPHALTLRVGQVVSAMSNENTFYRCALTLITLGEANENVGEKRRVKELTTIFVYS